jgi:hypothetical protein
VEEFEKHPRLALQFTGSFATDILDSLNASPFVIGAMIKYFNTVERNSRPTSFHDRAMSFGEPLSASRASIYPPFPLATSSKHPP